MDNIKITKRTVGNLKCSPGKDRTLFWDTEIRGFGVAAFKSGAKVYVVQYRKDGRSHRFALGKHGPLTAEQARSKARETLGKVIGGADPITERKEARAVRTFKEVAEDFLGHVARLKKPRTAEEYRRLLKNHVYPEIGSKRIVDVSSIDVARMHKNGRDASQRKPRARGHIERLEVGPRSRRKAEKYRPPLTRPKRSTAIPSKAASAI